MHTTPHAAPPRRRFRTAWRALLLLVVAAACRTLTSADVSVKNAPLDLVVTTLDRPRMQVTQTISRELAQLHAATADPETTIGVFCGSAGAPVRTFGSALRDAAESYLLTFRQFFSQDEIDTIQRAVTILNLALGFPAGANTEICKGILGAATSVTTATRDPNMLADLDATLRSWPLDGHRCLTLTLSPSQPDGAPLNWSFVTADINDAAVVQYIEPNRAWSDIYDPHCAVGTTWNPPTTFPWCGHYESTGFGPVKRCYRATGNDATVGFKSGLTGDFSVDVDGLQRLDAVDSHTFSAATSDGSGTFLFVGGPKVGTAFGPASYGEQRWSNSPFGPILRWGVYNFLTGLFYPSGGWAQDLGA